MPDSADVLRWMNIGDADVIAAIEDDVQRILNAVIAKVNRRYILPLEPTADELATFDQAIIMATARLWRRKTTPEGVMNFDGNGVIRVVSWDADVEDLLNDFRDWSTFS